jgi:plastocyanin
VRTSRVIAIALLLILFAGACGKSDKNKDSSGSSSGSTASVTAMDFRFDPTTVDVKAGSKVTVSLKNTGQAEHNFSISSLNVNKDLEKGDSTTVTFTAPSTPGDVQYFCEYHKDSKGMVGTLHVT